MPLPGSRTTIAVRPAARIRRASTASDPVFPPYPGTRITGPGRSWAGNPAAPPGDPPCTASTTVTTATAATTAATPAANTRRRGDSRPSKVMG